MCENDTSKTSQICIKHEKTCSNLISQIKSSQPAKFKPIAALSKFYRGNKCKSSNFLTAAARHNE